MYKGLRLSWYKWAFTTWIFLGQAAIHSEEWRALPDPLNHISRLATSGNSVWMLGKSSPHYRLFRYRDGDIASFDSTDNRFISGGWYPQKLFCSRDTLFIDQYYQTHWVNYRQVIRFDSVFSEIPIRRQLVAMEDESFHTWDGLRISEFFRGEWVSDRDFGLPALTGFLHMSFLLEDAKGGYWAGIIQYSDIPECRGVYRIDSAEVSAHFSDARVCFMDAALDSSGAVYFATNIGLMVFSNGVFKTLVPEDEGVNPEYNTVHVDRKGRLWAGNGVWDSSFQVMRIEDGKLKVVRGFDLDGQVTGGINDILEDEMGNVWIAGTNIPVYLYNDTAISRPASLHADKSRRETRPGTGRFRSFRSGTGIFDLTGRRHGKGK